MKENRQSGTRNMTVGSPAGHLLAFSLPLLAGSFLQQLYNMVDSWVVGNYVGDSALAAVGVGFPVVFMFVSLFMGLSNGGTVVIAQFYGAGKLDRVQDAIDTIYTSFLFSAVPITVIALLLVKPLLFILQVKPDAYADAWIYLTVISAGLIGSIGYNLNAGILGGLGNTGTTLLFLAISSVLNIILDFVLVLFCHLGVVGVALGTICSQLFSWIFGLCYINRKYPEISIRPFCRRFDKQLFRQIMGIGLPAGIQMSLVAIGSMAVMGRVNAFGKEYTAAYNVGSRLDQLGFLPVQSLANAVTAFVGQNIGANQMDRARKGIRITIVAAVIWSLLMQILIPLGPTLVAFFSDTPTVIQAGAVYLRCIMPFYPLFSVMFCLNNAMRGAGDSLFAMVDVILSLILLRVPAVFWLANHMGPDYMYYGIGIGWVLGFALSVIYYLSGRWKRRGSLAQENQEAPGDRHA